jgi:hypothetical protein
MSTSQTKKPTPPIDAAFEQIKELNEQLVAAACEASNLYLDSYEKAVDRAVSLEVKLAGLTRQEWLKSVIEAQAEITREFATSYAASARTLLK